jgi:hypothetical protein
MSDKPMTFDAWYEDFRKREPAIRPSDDWAHCWAIAQSACAAGPWEAIEGAPKDGKKFLVRDAVRNTNMASYAISEECWYVNGYRVFSLGGWTHFSRLVLP